MDGGDIPPREIRRHPSTQLPTRTFFHPAGTYASQSSIYGGYQPGSIDRMGQQDRPSTANLVKATLQSRPFPEQPIDLPGHT